MVQHKVAVLGAGVIGLSTAVCIQESCPACHVTIIADTFSPNTTSDGSGGFWCPYAVSEADLALVKETGLATYDHLKKLALSSDAGIAGVQMLTGFVYNQTRRVENNMVRQVLDCRSLTQKELADYPGYTSGVSFISPIVDVVTYMSWLMTRFKTNNGAVMTKRIYTVSELIGQWDVVVNCCGIGSAKLFNDPEVFPIRGQVIRVDAPWIKHFYNFNLSDGSLVYIIPGGRTTVVGGTAHKGNWSTEVDDDMEKEIWERAVRAAPNLTHAKKVSSWAGLRPARTKIRLEPDIIRHGSQVLRVVHNYGHGGSGVTLHWGCARKAAALTLDQLSGHARGHTGIDSNLKPNLKHRL